ncbi:hypothetical protein LPJ61_002448 [Coemansia biformis]|uniref:RPA-interacting protein N-terminal domain-containing protein n=1 Tax=Coemansia biformis TaxID=1286918 RepID=A0A9W7YDB3_9FUNG|nr:hypothetical protein LPJ61_002448 [Coemansia biformis]
MNSYSLFSSPPRQAPSAASVRQIARSGGAPTERGRRPTYRHLSNTSREARNSEQPWRQQFRAQCADRLSKAREQSVMLRRQLTQLSRSAGGAAAPEEPRLPALSEEEICAIVQQEWARFQAEMEQQSLEYGVLDASILDEIDEDMGWGGASLAGSDEAQDHQMQELAEWEEYENQMLEEDMMEAALQDAGALLDVDVDAGSDSAMFLDA